MLTPVSVGTGYGQPISTLYDWTLDIGPSKDISYRLPFDIEARLKIERFCDKVSKAIYSNRSDPVGLSSEEARSTMTSLLVRDFEELEAQIGTEISRMLPSNC